MTTKTIDRDTPAPIGPERRGARHRAARFAGASYLVMFALAIFANFAVVEGLVVSGDAEATVANIAGSIGLFRMGVAAFLVIVLLDVAIAWALHVVFGDVDPRGSLATAWFRLVYSGFLGVAVVFLYQALVRVTGAGVDPSSVMASLDTFQQVWAIGLVAFGVHLALLGRLVLSSGFAPRALGVVLSAAGIVYVVDTFAQILMSDYDAVAGVLLAAVAGLSMIGEGWLGVWLLVTRRLSSGGVDAT